MRKERYKRLVMFFSSLIVIGLETANYAYVWFNCYNRRDIIRIYYWRRGHWALIGMYFLIVFLMSELFGALRVGYMRLSDVLIAQICSVAATNAVTYLQLALIGRWRAFTHIGPLLRLSGVNGLLVILWVLLTRWIYTRLYPARSVILIYDAHNPEKLLKNIASRKDKYRVLEAILVDRGLPYLKERILHYEICILGDIPSRERNILIRYCFEHNIRCYSSPKISDIMLMSADKIHMFDTPLLLMRNRGLTAEQKFAKRLLDIVVCVFLTVLLSPVLLLIAILIRLSDGGPVLYRQERLTENGRVFRIYKFRSMITGSEKEGARLAKEGDARITPVGRVLRKIHFDELPQLFNILRGDMSIVGPRPERPEIAAEYEREIPEFAYRLKVKAGLTGYAQVFGKYNTRPYDKLKLDLTYIENYSLWLDFQLVASTVKILFQKENTEGVEEGQVTAYDGSTKASDVSVLEEHVQKAVEEIQWQEKMEAYSSGDDLKKPEKAAALPKGVRVQDVAAEHEMGLLVSVIMPAYNSSRTIGEAVESVLRQDMHFQSSQKVGRGALQELELIIVDDCSGDDLEGALERFLPDPRIRIFRNEKRLGVAKSRNRAALFARGLYIAFLDSDDIWARDKLKKQFARIFETGCVFCCTGRELMESNGRLTGRIIGVKETLTEKDLRFGNPINCSSVLLLTSVARRFPMVHEDSHEDYVAWMNILRTYGSACGVNEPLLKYRLSETGKSGKKWKSAKMTYRAYRYMGYGPVRSSFYFLGYAVHGVLKYYGRSGKH